MKTLYVETVFIPLRNKANCTLRQQLGDIIDANTVQFELLKGLPIYDWNEFKNILDFNHVIALPQKNGQSYPLFDYEQISFDRTTNLDQGYMSRDYRFYAAVYGFALLCLA